MFLESLWEFVINAVASFKDNFIGDIGWAVFVLLMLTLGIAPKYLYHKWARTLNDPEAMKKKWFGAGHVVVWLNTGSNQALRFASFLGTFILIFGTVAIGMSRSGKVADAGSSMTTLPPVIYVLVTIDEQYNDTSVVYIKRVLDFDGDNVVTEKLGRSILIPPANKNANTVLEKGVFLSVALFQGQTLIGTLSDETAFTLVEQENGRWWNWLGRKADALIHTERRPNVANASMTP